MNRNTQSHFSSIPSINISRSKFERPFDHKTTFNTGDLVPIYCDETIMPGDTVKMKMSEVIRMMTPIAPVMDCIFADIYFFSIPLRLLWEHWVNFYGENDTAPWTQTTPYTIPQIVAPDSGWDKGSIADYLGYPTKVGKYKASAFPFRAYCKCFNDWFRDENLKNPVYMSTGDSDTQGLNYDSSTYDYVTDTEKGAKCLKAAKPHDVFTSALPEPQKGPEIAAPIGDKAPIVGGALLSESGRTQAADSVIELFDTGVNWYTATQANSQYVGRIEAGTNEIVGQGTAMGLYADLSSAIGLSINQLRQAYAVQKYYENCARGGTRYIESIKAHFNVNSSDARLQRSEYLGGKRINININQIVQTEASAAGITPMGTTGAYSVTADSDDDLFTYSAEEHCVLLGLMCVRTEHGYQQGLNRQHSMKELFDYYTPELANLGEVGILNKEIYIEEPGSTGEKNEEAFGYQEAWYWYRYHQNRVSGEMRSNYTTSLDIWHYADYYNALPKLGDEWIDETEENVKRTIAVQNHDQFFGDFYFNPVYTRPMPLYSVPGLTGHY